MKNLCLLCVALFLVILASCQRGSLKDDQLKRHFGMKKSQPTLVYSASRLTESEVLYQMTWQIGKHTYYRMTALADIKSNPTIEEVNNFNEMEK